MKRYFLLPLVILSFVFTACTDISNESSLTREYSPKYKGVYLTTINGVKTLCYEDYDRENLRTHVAKHIDNLSDEDYFKYFDSHSKFISFGVRDCCSCAVDLEYYDLIGYVWQQYDDQRLFDLSEDLYFFSLTKDM